MTDGDSTQPWRAVAVSMLPMFDARARYAYALLAAMLIGTAVSLAVMGFTVVPGAAAYSGIAIGSLVFSATMFRRLGWPRVSTGMETAALMAILSSGVILLQFPLAAISVGDADALLIKADHMLGFDWYVFSRQFQSPWALWLLTWAYRSMIPQCAVAVVLLAYSHQVTRAWRTVTSAFLSMAASILPFPLFAAEGRYVGCGLNARDIAILPHTCDYGPVIRMVRVDGMRTIEPWMNLGLVSFPSFHAAAAVALIWAMWPYRWLRFPLIVLNGAMVIAAIVIAGHYLIDIVGGFAAAGAAIWLVRRHLHDIPAV